MNIIRKKNCPVCNQFGSVVKNGKFKDGRQAYYCKICKRSFLENPKKTRSTKGKERGLIKKEKFEQFKRLMLNQNKSFTFKEIVKKLHITRQTIYRWRDRLTGQGYDNINLVTENKEEVENKLKTYFKSIDKLV